MRTMNLLSLGVVLLALGTCPSLAIAEDAPDSAAATSQPQRERDLIAILMDARKEYQTAKTPNPAQDARMDMQLRVIGYMRQSQIADKWIGTVKSRGLTPEGNAWIVIEIADGITVGTWQSQRDDVESGSLIREHAPLFSTFQQAKLGSTVIFDATILKSVLASDDDMVLRPQFIARFGGLKITQ
jgi:hypothetical protein